VPAVDTDVLVRLVARDDAGQTASAEEFVANGVWVSVLTLAEAVWVLGTKYGHTAASQFAVIEMFLQSESLVLEHSEAVAAALDLFRSHPKLGFSDCLILELARKAGHLPLGTFDRSLGSVQGTQRL
jgi:predicted nucleic-acid-binding protein